jgi:hypothetical protein
VRPRVIRRPYGDGDLLLLGSKGGERVVRGEGALRRFLVFERLDLNFLIPFDVDEDAKVW